jgi:RNA-binding protein 25
LTRPFTTNSVSVPLAFGVDDEISVKPKREIVPIDYTDEARAPSSAERSTATTERVDASKLKALVERIPTDRDALFAFPIDWAVVDAQGLVESKMRAWTGKKMLEYLGEEEPAMVDFVLAKLRDHVRPQAILDELRQVLEEEADMFVALLWRKLAFEAARANLL